MKKRKQWPWALAAFTVSAVVFWLLWNIQPLSIEIARQSLFDCFIVITMIVWALMAFAIGIMITIQKIVVV